MKTNRTANMLRTMAWERAKGELTSMLHTYYPDNDPKDKFEQIQSLIDKFIADVEGDELEQ